MRPDTQALLDALLADSSTLAHPVDLSNGVRLDPASPDDVPAVSRDEVAQRYRTSGVAVAGEDPNSDVRLVRWTDPSHRMHHQLVWCVFAIGADVGGPSGPAPRGGATTERPRSVPGNQYTVYDALSGAFVFTEQHGGA